MFLGDSKVNIRWRDTSGFKTEMKPVVDSRYRLLRLICVALEVTYDLNLRADLF